MTELFAFDDNVAGADRLLSLLDQASLSEDVGQALIAKVDLREALELAKSISWADASENDAWHLLKLAELIAPMDVDAARSAFARYEALKAVKSRSSSIFIDERFYAHELRARGFIERAQRHLDASDESFTQAFQIYDRLQFRHEAARTALELASRRDGETYYAYARSERVRRPKSALARRIVSAGSSIRRAQARRR